MGWTKTGGKTPRFFALALSGKFLFAANEDTDTVNLFKRDAASGRLVAADRVVHIGSPVCILIKTP
ncbi:beta-propeller fold lactonase family protein [Bradyrhizobium sp. 17]|uniref:lactonase family protein n=1 Tax=Bradyrhizobium sp. 17 TaxID=2782649 RepID=UPI001FF931DB